MYRVVIALIDATRARLFTLDRTTDGGATHEQLVERTDLVNTARRRRPSELLSDSRPGSSRTGPLQYGFDDHRDQYMAQLDVRFGRTALAALRELIDEHGARRLILCAPPRMLGKLRASAPGILPPELVIDEIPRDLVKLSTTELRAELTSYGTLPAAPAGGAFVAR